MIEIMEKLVELIPVAEAITFGDDVVIGWEEGRVEAPKHGADS